MRRATGGIDILRRTQQQHVTQKIENRLLHCRVAAFGCGDGAFDNLSVLFVYRLARLDIGSVNGEARNRLAHGARERFEREIAIPAISFGQSIEHVAQNIHVIGQGKLHHQKFFCIEQMPERNGMADETMKRFCDRSFRRRIDQQLHDVIGEIVAGGSMHWPVFAQFFRAGENFFRDHIDRPTVARQPDPERFRATLLKF